MKCEIDLLNDEQEDWFDAKNGMVVEVVGFVVRDAMLMAVWIRDDGRLKEIPAWALRVVVLAKALDGP